MFIFPISFDVLFAISDLDFPEYVIICVMSSAYCTSEHPFAGWGRSLVYIIYSVGKGADPCGFPTLSGNGGALKSPTVILACLFFMKLVINVVIVLGRFGKVIFYFRPSCHTLSNVFDTSLSTMYVWPSLDVW